MGKLHLAGAVTKRGTKRKREQDGQVRRGKDWLQGRKQEYGNLGRHAVANEHDSPLGSRIFTTEHEKGICEAAK